MARARGLPPRPFPASCSQELSYIGPAPKGLTFPRDSKLSAEGRAIFQNQAPEVPKLGRRPGDFCESRAERSPDSAEGRTIFPNQSTSDPQTRPNAERFFRIKALAVPRLGRRPKDFCESAFQRSSDSAKGRAIFANQSSSDSQTRPEAERFSKSQQQR